MDGAVGEIYGSLADGDVKVFYSGHNVCSANLSLQPSKQTRRKER